MFVGLRVRNAPAKSLNCVKSTVWSQGQPGTPSTPGGGLTVNALVQVLPRFLDCQSGALRPQLPEKAVITSCSGCRGLTAMLISPSLNVSVSCKFESVLFTTVSTTKTSNCTGFPGSAVPAAVKGSKSSATAGREYEFVSGGELRRSSSALETETPPAVRIVRYAACTIARAVTRNLRCSIVVSSRETLRSAAN